MEKGWLMQIALFVALGLIPMSTALGAPSKVEVDKLMDSARAVEAPVFAPKAFEKAKNQYDLAVIPSRSSSDVSVYLTKVREYTENAIKNAEVCKLTLKEYLSSRDKAKIARAPILVPELYSKAETQFIVATGKVESGDVKGGLKEATKSLPMFDSAELEAIRVGVLGRADSLIETAVVDEAPKYALSTLDRARTARAKANNILTSDRYNQKVAMVEALRSEYEARHASNIAQSVRSLDRNDQAWEKLMLLYEIQMNRVGEALKMPYLPFDNGPLAAADSLIVSIRKIQVLSSADYSRTQDSISVLQRVISNMQSIQDGLTSQLTSTSRLVAQDTTPRDAMATARAIDSGVVNLLAEKNRLSDQVAAYQTKLGELSEQHKEVSAELQERQDREDRIINAKTMIDPTQGEVFVNSTNDIVLRLFGLSFEAGKSEIVEQHLPLLEKVKQIIALFSNRNLVIEGHTDGRGDSKGNIQLSEKRAFVVMQYLRQTMAIPSDRIRVIGYGSDKPIASQATEEGRSKNRRIDILILQ